MHRGYVKLFRKTRDNPRLHDPDFLSVWIWCLLEATHSEKESLLGGKKIVLKPGQFTTGRKQLSELSGVQESKIERVLNFFTNECQIEQQKTNTNRLISIVNWNTYQEGEQRMNNNRTTDEQQVNTPKAFKNEKNEKNEKNNTFGEFFSFWNEYPKKVGKGDAEKAWKKIKEPKATLDLIITALEWQKKSDQWKKEGGQFIPNPATYLNRKHWGDEPQIKKGTDFSFLDNLPDPPPPPDFTEESKLLAKRVNEAYAKILKGGNSD